MGEREKRQFVRGMTLLELLIVVAIIGVLSSIVYPSYSQHVRKGHRQQAITDMTRIQLHLESNYQQGYDTAPFIDNGICQDFCTVDKSRYTISVVSSTSSYTITATPLANSGQDKDQCAGETYSELSLNQLGEMMPAECWRQ